MAVIEQRFCLDDFSITITGVVPCSLDVSSAHKQLQYAASELVADRSENPLTINVTATRVPFTYRVGAPEKTDFASIYTKTRVNGTSGVPPDMGYRSFDPPSPVLTGAANELKNAIFLVTLPSYTEDEVSGALGGGTDVYNLSVIIREASYNNSEWVIDNFQS